MDLRTSRVRQSIPLVEEMRYPSGDLSCDGSHLAVPGKYSWDNKPVISVWRIRNGKQRFLWPAGSVCPYRYFEFLL